MPEASDNGSQPYRNASDIRGIRLQEECQQFMNGEATKNDAGGSCMVG